MNARVVAVLRLAAVGLALTVACGSGDPGGRPENLEADARALADALANDPARLPLEEVDEAIRDDRPVLGADLIAQGAIPATERQIEILRGLELTSAEGRRFRTRAMRLHRDRIRALEQMRAALSRGIGHEDDQLLAAMHADAEAQIAIVALTDELGRIVPRADERPPLEERGLPPRLPSREELGVDPTPPSERPEDPNPGAAEPIAPPEPE